MIYMFVSVELRRVRGSALGLAWTFLEPLLMLTVLVFVFSNLFMNQTLPNFVLYVLLNVILWQFFVRGTIGGLTSVIAKGPMISSVYFPRQILPISSSIASLVMTLFDLIIFCVFMAVFQFIPPLTAILLPAVIVMELVLILGLSLSLSALHVYYRDTLYIWQIVVYAGFFLTPVFYNLDLLPANVRDIVLLNPMAQLITMAHNAVLYDELPSAAGMIYTTTTISIILLIGVLVFRKLEPRLAEEVS